MVFASICKHASTALIIFFEHEQWSNLFSEEQAHQKIQLASSEHFVNFPG